MTYTRARWILSWIQISLLLAVCISGIFGQFPNWMQTQFEALPNLIPIGIYLGIYVLISIPGDFIGGYFLPKRYGKKIMSFSKWIKAWARGTAIHFLFLWLFGASLLFISLWVGKWGTIGLMVILMMFLTGMQLYIAQLVGGFTTKMESSKGRPVLYFKNRDVRFTGGISGLPGKESIVLPQSWTRHFSSKMQEMLLARRHGTINTGLHGKGIFYAVLANLVFFTASVFLSGPEIATPSGIISISLCFTLLSVIGMLVGLPVLSRKAVFEVDRWAYFHGGDPSVLRESFSKTGSLQYPEPASIPAIAKPFYSLPTPLMRTKNMETQKDHKGGWQAERMAIYLSWAGLNLLSRSMHYHIGRPELWVFLPSD